MLSHDWTGYVQLDSWDSGGRQGTCYPTTLLVQHAYIHRLLNHFIIKLTY